MDIIWFLLQIGFVIFVALIAYREGWEEGIRDERRRIIAMNYQIKKRNEE